MSNDFTKAVTGGVWFMAGALAALAASKDPPALDLGDPAVFNGLSEARATCSPDAIVWIDPESGYFYTALLPEFSVKKPGVFACRSSALSANYWDSNPFGVAADRGRNFPINPDLLCPECS